MEATTKRKSADVAQLQGYIDAIRSTSELGAVAVRTRHRWDGGYAVDSQVERLQQAGEEMPREHHKLRTDWPEPFGSDSGPTPGAEALVTALGACVATTFAVKAAQQGVALDALEVTVDGKVDLRGLFELDGVAPRFTSMVVTVHVRSDADDETLEALAATAAGTSPVFDSLANPVEMEIEVGRK